MIQDIYFALTCKIYVLVSYFKLQCVKLLVYYVVTTCILQHYIFESRGGRARGRVYGVLMVFIKKCNFGAGSGTCTGLGARGRAAFPFGAGASGGPKMFRGRPEPRFGPEPVHPYLKVKLDTCKSREVFPVIYLIPFPSSCTFCTCIIALSESLFD